MMILKIILQVFLLVAMLLKSSALNQEQTSMLTHKLALTEQSSVGYNGIIHICPGIIPS